MIELLKSRRSIRRYEDREIEKEKIDALLKAALLAPSSRNRRPWEFIAVTDKELLKKLSESKEHGSKFLEGAKLGIVVIADKEVCDVWIEDASIAATLIQVTAHSLGLGSCWIQMRERMRNKEEKAEDYIRKLLNIPDKYGVECVISVGYPAEEKKAYEESNLDYNKIHYNYYSK
ncbi:nitroreductase family protein [Caproiciproducens sp. MSJ-32]|uniref:nitroreductase family protein n=1 Tax=Caproiciproducens sp. MSJ-32 TaxID=2841527 RepID=UPI001C103815|nr:nitroreductase family protein [Caproiciproducens sp. MSJ-32]MBU5453860.1 nitroreductase family protein [Caproiciproducens sp. MSJ-32]